MTKSDLVARVSEIYPYMNPKNIDRVVGIIFEAIINALKDGRRVELRGFGSFAVRSRRGITGRNPRTGETVEVAPKKVPFFKAGKQLKELLNDVTDSEGTK
jgi:integration host factor subunit beta